MRIDHLQEGLREGRKFRFHFKLDACRQERKPFEQTLHIGIGNLGVGDVEARGDFWKFGGKLRAHFAQEREFALIMAHQVGIHQRVPFMSLTTASRVSTSIAVSR